MMASLADIRQQYPQYNDMPDADLADALHSKFYSDMPRDQFNAKIGYGPNPLNVIDPMTAQQEAPLGPVARFVTTAAAKAGSGLANLYWNGPVGAIQSAIDPETTQKQYAGGTALNPGGAVEQSVYKNVAPEYKPTTAAGRMGLATTAGAMAGGPFGVAGAVLGGAGGLTSQGAGELGLPPSLQLAAGLAPALLGRPASALLRSPETKAASLILSRLEADARAGGPTAQTMGADLANANGAPLTLADVGGEATKGLAEKVATAPGEGRQIATQFLNDRDAAAGPRLVKALDDNISNGGDAFTTAKALGQQRAQAAAPLYEKAFAQNPIQSDRLTQFLQDPIVQQGMARGIEIQRLEALSKGEPFDPNFYTLKPNAEGLPQPQGIPNMRTLDAVKRGLDDILEGYRDPTTGRLNLDQRGRAINDVRASYLGELDKLNPDYAAARNAWAGPSQSMAAMRMGQNFRNMRPEQIADQIANMSDSEKQFFKLGAADALRQGVAKTSSGGNEALRIVGNDYVKQQLRPLFSTDDAYSKFIGAAQNENRMFQTRQQMLGNSRTAMRLAEAQAEGGEGGLPGAIATTTTGLATGEHGLTALGLFRGVKPAWRAMTAPSPATNAAAARMLFNPAISQQALQQIMAARLGTRLPLSPALMSPSLLNPPQANGPLSP